MPAQAFKPRLPEATIRQYHAALTALPPVVSAEQLRAAKDAAVEEEQWKYELEHRGRALGTSQAAVRVMHELAAEQPEPRRYQPAPPRARRPSIPPAKPKNDTAAGRAAETKAINRHDNERQLANRLGFSGAAVRQSKEMAEAMERLNVTNPQRCKCLAPLKAPFAPKGETCGDCGMAQTSTVETRTAAASMATSAFLYDKTAAKLRSEFSRQIEDPKTVSVGGAGARARAGGGAGAGSAGSAGCAGCAGDGHAAVAADADAAATQAGSIVLAGCGLDDDDAAVLADWIESCAKPLGFVSLRGNLIGAAGAAAISRALLSDRGAGKTIMKVDLAQNLAGAESAELLRILRKRQPRRGCAAPAAPAFPLMYRVQLCPACCSRILCPLQPHGDRQHRMLSSSCCFACLEAPSRSPCAGPAASRRSSRRRA